MFCESATRTQRFSFQGWSSNKGKLEKEVADALLERDTIKKETDELEKSRVELSKAVLSAREESKKFTSQIDSIDAELRLLDTEYEQADRLLNQLNLSIETTQLRLQQPSRAT